MAVVTPGLIDITLYDGTVRLQFSASGHRYKISTDDGVSWVKRVGVTTVLGVLSKDGLIPWAANLAASTFRDIALAAGHSLSTSEINDAYELARKAHSVRKDAGAAVGSEVHDWIARFLLRPQAPPGVTSLSAPAKLAISAFLQWISDNGVRFLASERPVYSKEHDYCGTFDALVEIKGRTILLDFKTGDARKEVIKGKYTGKTKAYPEHMIQVGGYSLAVREEKPSQTIDAHGILYIQKDGKLNYFETTHVSANEAAFVQVLGVYRYIQYLTIGVS